MDTAALGIGCITKSALQKVDRCDFQQDEVE